MSVRSQPWSLHVADLRCGPMSGPCVASGDSQPDPSTPAAGRARRRHGRRKVVTTYLAVRHCLRAVAAAFRWRAPRAARGARSLKSRRTSCVPSFATSVPYGSESWGAGCWSIEGTPCAPVAPRRRIWTDLTCAIRGAAARGFAHEMSACDTGAMSQSATGRAARDSESGRPIHPALVVGHSGTAALKGSLCLGGNPSERVLRAGAAGRPRETRRS